jgi:hypothetical protein
MTEKWGVGERSRVDSLGSGARGGGGRRGEESDRYVEYRK